MRPATAAIGVKKPTTRAAALSAFALLLAAGCGGGPRLSNLRCRTTPCQDVEDPFLLHLAVDFDDATGTLGAGALELRLNGATQTTLLLADLFKQAQLAPATQHGTLDLDDEVQLDAVTQGEAVAVSVLAHDGAGQQSNEPELTFNLRVGAFRASAAGSR